MRMSRTKQRQGMVYTMTNSSTSNEVVALRRGLNGRLAFDGSYRTNGRGTGRREVDPLESQGSIILSQDGRLLFVVNAGSNSISSFRVKNRGDLSLADVHSSEGVQPNSICVHDNLLYVANAGNSDKGVNSGIAGFKVDINGRLSIIPSAVYPLSTRASQPAGLVISPDGSKIVVSELNTNRLTVFNVDRNGRLTGPVVNQSNGAGPFGSAFLSNGILLVSEAGTNALSSYRVNRDGTLSVVSGSVLSGQQATCWVSASRHEHFAYTSNAGSGTISIYRIKPTGKLALISNVASTRNGEAAPIDNGISRDGRNLYVLNGNEGSVSVFGVLNTGRLKLLQVFRPTGLPMVGAQGLAVR